MKTFCRKTGTELIAICIDNEKNKRKPAGQAALQWQL